MVMQPPLFGTKLVGLDTSTPGVILYGVTPDDKVIPVKVDDQGILSSNVTLVGDIVVGAFVIEDPNTGKKANVVFDGTNNALVVTADFLPLPAGAATEATLSFIETTLTDGSQKTQIVDGMGDAVGVTGNALDTNIKSVGGSSLTLGQKVMASSIPVVIASDQSPVPVTLSGASGGVVSVQASSANGLTINGSVSILGQPIQVEAATGTGLTVYVGNTPSVDLNDGSGNPITSQVSGSKRALDVGIDVAGVQVDPRQIRTLVPSDTVSVQALSASGITVNIQGSATGLTVNVANQPLTVLSSSTSGLTVNGTVTAKIEDTAGNSLTSTSGSLNVNITGGESSTEQHTVDSSGDTYNPGTTRGIVADARVVSSPPSLTNGQFTALNVTPAGRLVTDNSQVVQPVVAASASGLTVNGTVSSKLEDGSGNNITSQTNGSQRALDVGIDVAGVQVDPRSIRALTSADVVSIQSLSASGLTINGTATSNQGTPNTTANAWPTKITDGISTAAVTNAAPLGTEQGLVVRNIPSGTQVVSGSGNFTVVQPTGTNLHTVVDNTVSIQAASASGITVNGTVTANQGTANATPWNDNVAQWGGSTTSLGQKVMGSSVPVVLASDQITALTPGTVSIVNSSTSTLGSGGVFTGTYENVTNYAVISVSIISDQSSAASGFVFQWSSDGVNLDRTETTNLTGGVQGRAFSLTVRAKFFRIVYTNGAVGQTIFRLSTIYHQTGYGHISKPISQILTDDNFAEPVVGATFGRLSSGTWKPTPASTGNSLVVAQEVAYQSSLGTVFSVTADNFNLAASGTDNPVILIKNPNASGKTIYISKIIFGTITTNRASALKLWANPTITTNGSATTPVNNLIGNGTTSVSTSFTSPTVSSAGTILRGFASGQNTRATADNVELVVQLPANNNLFITGAPSANNTVVSVTVVWMEI